MPDTVIGNIVAAARDLHIPGLLCFLLTISVSRSLSASNKKHNKPVSPAEDIFSLTNRFKENLENNVNTGAAGACGVYGCMPRVLSLHDRCPVSYVPCTCDAH